MGSFNFVGKGVVGGGGRGGGVGVPRSFLLILPGHSTPVLLYHHVLVFLYVKILQPTAKSTGAAIICMAKGGVHVHSPLTPLLLPSKTEISVSTNGYLPELGCVRQQ